MNKTCLRRTSAYSFSSFISLDVGMNWSNTLFTFYKGYGLVMSTE